MWSGAAERRLSKGCGIPARFSKERWAALLSTAPAAWHRPRLSPVPTGREDCGLAGPGGHRGQQAAHSPLDGRFASAHRSLDGWGCAPPAHRAHNPYDYY